MATKINREALRQRIKTLAGLSDDERAALLELVNSKKYGLVWENHPEEVEERLRTHLPVLDEVPERYIPGSSASSPNHILIEGDNLEALTALTYTHEGRIDVIYIDPPYNTGNKDFSYNDHYVDADDDYRHSKWLSFMSKRLRIAKRLLSDRGVIFISIDDNEQANLKLLCDEMFGRGNFIAQVIWERAYAPVNLKKHFSESHDYIVCYAKRVANAICNGLPRTDEANSKYKNPDNDPRGLWRTDNLAVGPRVESQVYEITTPSGRKVWPPEGYCWRLSKERFEEYVKDNRIWFGENGDLVPAPKRFMAEVKNSMTPMTVWKYTEVGHSQDAMRSLRDIFDGKVLFTYPKSVPLIERVVRLYSFKDSTVLDFFAGSGTTMHAVMQLNKEDGGHRQCILVTNNENKICEEVTYERNRRVIEGYTTPKGVEVEGLRDNSLRYYRTRLLPRQRTNRNMRDLMAAATDLLCIKEDIFEELRIQNLEIRNIRKHVRLFGKGDRQMMVIYSEEAIPRIVQWLKTTPPLPSSEGWPKAGVCPNPIKIYTFSYTNYAYDDDFAEVEDRVQLCALPAAIYEAYRRVLPQEDRYYDNEIIDGSDTNEGKEDNQ